MEQGDARLDQRGLEAEHQREPADPDKAQGRTDRQPHDEQHEEDQDPNQAGLGRREAHFGSLRNACQAKIPATAAQAATSASRSGA